MTANKIKYLYVRDPREPRRVLSIARQKVGDGKFKFAVALNIVLSPELFGGVYDPFTKASAHSILQGRIEKDKTSYVIEVSPDQFVGTSILKFIANPPKEFRYNKETETGLKDRVSRVARRALKHYASLQRTKKESNTNGVFVSATP